MLADALGIPGCEGVRGVKGLIAPEGVGGLRGFVGEGVEFCGELSGCEPELLYLLLTLDGMETILGQKRGGGYVAPPARRILNTSALIDMDRLQCETISSYTNLVSHMRARCGPQDSAFLSR